MFSRSSALHLTLVVPGLAQALGTVTAGEFRLPQLERLVGRARAEEGMTSYYEALLFALFGLAQPKARDVPLAAVMYPWDKEETSTPSGWWLRADPVFLQPDRDRLVLCGPRYLGLNEAETRSLARTVSPLFTEYGWRFEAVRPERWYLCLPQAEAVNFTALGAVEGQYIGPRLPVGSGAQRWRTLLNEIQMSLHECATNRERESRGAWPVNSLWFWGAGTPPPCPPAPWQQVGWRGEAPLLRALAAYCGVPGALLPQKAGQWLAQHPAPGEHLLVLDSLLQATEPWHCQEVLFALENDWFSVLYKALQRQAIASLTLYPLNGCRYHLSWSRTWQWWRRSRSLITDADGW